MITPPCASPQRRPERLPEAVSPDELHAIGLAHYGTPRFLAEMSRDTGIPYRTLRRYAQEGTDKPLAVKAIRELKAELGS